MVELDPFRDLPPGGEVETDKGRAYAEQLARQAVGRPSAEMSPALRQVGICGAGIMGAGIAAANVQHGLPVCIYDAAPDAVSRTVDQLRQLLPVATATTTAAGPEVSCAPIVACRDQQDLAQCDLVIESVVENREVKQRIFHQLAAQVEPTAILASNTSTIPIRELASMPHPERFCGLHFCNPVPQRRLVEIVRGEQTGEHTIDAARQYAVRIGKLPVVVEDRPGFLVNRLLLPYLNEALEMACQGADLQALDNAARGFGMVMGPIELFDLIGTDTAMWAGRTLWEAFPDRIALTPLLPALVKRNRLGRKTGVGFYRYLDPGSRGQGDPEMARILAPYVRRRREFSPQEITWRLFLPMLVEATRVIEERVIRQTSDIDLALLHGLAFPADRGGLLYWADTLGAATIVALLKPFESLGTRMHATELLREMARSERRFCELADLGG